MSVAVTWLGQAGLLVETGWTRLLIDPFLSDHEARLYPAPPPEPYLADLDAVLVTHEHLDHLDAELLPRLPPDVRVVVPEPVVELVRGGRAVGVTPGAELALTEDVSVEIVPAWHALAPADGYSTGGGRFVGYIVSTPGLRLYHAGDTLVTEELVARLSDARIDVAVLPINGRDAFREQRGIAGNMSVREAVELALRIGASTLVPVHWDLFAGNTESPGRAVDEAVATEAPLHVVVLRRFVPFVFAAVADESP